MALIDDVRALVSGGAEEHEIKQALRQIAEERELAETAAELPNLPALPAAFWTALKAYLTAPGGPADPFRMLTSIHDAIEADNPQQCLRAMIGLVKAVTRSHPGLRQRLAPLYFRLTGRTS